jgi:hypothetical protein
MRSIRLVAHIKMRVSYRCARPGYRAAFDGVDLALRSVDRLSQVRNVSMCLFADDRSREIRPMDREQIDGGMAKNAAARCRRRRRSQFNATVHPGRAFDPSNLAFMSSRSIALSDAAQTKTCLRAYSVATPPLEALRR